MLSMLRPGACFDTAGCVVQGELLLPDGTMLEPKVLSDDVEEGWVDNGGMIARKHVFKDLAAPGFDYLVDYKHSCDSGSVPVLYSSSRIGASCGAVPQLVWIRG